MRTIGQDLRYALRGLWKSPSFAVVSTLTLALAIGVNTSIFSLVSVIIFADLPMDEAETVQVVRGVNAELEINRDSVSPADYLDLVERSRSFESLSALGRGQWVLTGGDEREVALRSTTSFRGRFTDLRNDETAALQPVECGVHGGDRSLRPGAPLKLFDDRDAIRLIRQAGNGEQDHLLEFPQVFASGHRFFHECE